MVVSARGQTDLLTRAIGGGQITTEWTSVRGICAPCHTPSIVRKPLFQKSMPSRSGISGSWDILLIVKCPSEISAIHFVAGHLESEPLKVTWSVES